MRFKCLKTIDKKINVLCKKFHKIGFKYGYRMDVIDHDGLYYKPKFFIRLEDNYFGYIGRKILVDAKKEMNKLGFQFLGMGSTRFTVGYKYHNKNYAIKIPIVEQANKNELEYAQTFLMDQDVCLVPRFYWNNESFGTILAFPRVVVLKKEWSPVFMEEIKEGMGYPKRLVNNHMACQRIEKMLEYTNDLHNENIGWIGKKPYLIDYDLNLV